MAITKSTDVQSITVYPPDTDPGAPTVEIVLVDKWDDPDDDELPITKTRTIFRGRNPSEDPALRTQIDDLPLLAQEVCKTVWWYD